MRNLKKLLAVIVAICVLATFTVPAFAADTTATKTDAQLAEELGVLKGAGDGVTDAYLATTPTRLQGAIMFLRLLGLEDEALAFTGTDNFADVPATYAADSKAVLAYLKAHPELGFEGVGGGNFNPAGLMTAKEYYKIVLVALGFTYGTDFTWDTVLSFAAQHGLSKLIDNTSFKVSDLATATIEGLKATVKDGSGTLVAKLAADDEDFAAKAIAAGLYTVPVVKPAVVSVESDSLTRVVVTFNKAIDKDTIATGDFVVDGEDISGDNVDVSDDGKVVTLKTWADMGNKELSNGDEISIEVSGISDANEVEMTDYEGTFTPTDNAQPTVEGIEFTGPETIDISFSEPMHYATDINTEIQIDGDTYSAEAPNDYNDKDKITVDLGTELDEGEHTFKIKGFEDFAGYANVVKSITKDYQSIDTAPTATVKEADQSTVTLKFNRPVTGFDSADQEILDKFYQSYSNWHPLEIQDADGNVITTDTITNKEGDDVTADPAKYYDEVVLVFTNAAKAVPDTKDGADDGDRPLPTGNVKVVVKDEAVKDRWDNKVDGDLVLSATISADNGKPEVKKVTVENESEIRVYYSEDVKVSDATDEGNFVIKDSKKEVVKASKWGLSYNTTDDYTAVKFTNPLDEGTYTITIEGIADTSLSENTLDTVTKEFKVTDKTAKDLSDISVTSNEDKVLYVWYGEDMAVTGDYSVLDKDNYRIGTKEFSDDVKLKMFNSKTVEITFPKAELPPVGSFLTIGKVADKALNTVKSLAEDILIKKEAGPVIGAINRIDHNKYELELDKEVKSLASGAIKVIQEGTNQEAVTGAKVINDGEDTVIQFSAHDTLKNDVETVSPVTGTFTVVIAEDSIKSLTGAPMAKGNVTMAVNDKVAPEVATEADDDPMVYAYDNEVQQAGKLDYIDTIVIHYTEALDPETVGKYTYEIDGYKIKNVLYTPGTTVVTLKLEELKAADFDPDYKDELTLVQKLGIKDTNDNELAPDEYDIVPANKVPGA